jgi:manganese-dependent ADP-ribose/CDP-alcohol diphosphatase
MSEPRRSQRINKQGKGNAPSGNPSEPQSRKRRKTRLFAGQLPIETRPKFTFGIVADIQYADIPDGTSYAGVPRYYRHSLEVARHAAQHYQTDKVSLVLNLGDIVDGKAQDLKGHGGEPLPDGVDPGHSAIDDVLEALSVYTHGPILHTYGNHELYNCNREDLGKKLGIPFVKEPCGDLVGYWSHVHEGVRFVVLDSYDISLMQRCPETSHKRRKAEAILTQHNPNFPQYENSPQGLSGVLKRYVAFNGAVDDPQLEWLRTTLQTSRDQGEKVIIISHQPILPGSSSDVCLVWNYAEVLQVLRAFSDVVIASFCGHAHKGGYKRDTVSGIHFRVIEAVLENMEFVISITIASFCVASAIAGRPSLTLIIVPMPVDTVMSYLPRDICMSIAQNTVEE